jgi:hypothetical protein
MSERTWFYASQGQQQGPYPESQFRELFARGIVTPSTLVWSEGMASWQRAADIPGLFSGGAAPPAVPGAGGVISSAQQGGALSLELGIWPLIWRSLVLLFGILFIIPTPWVITMYWRWIVSCVRVPGRPNLAFTGRAGTLMWLYAVFVAVIAIAVLAAIFSEAKELNHFLNLVMDAIMLPLYWLLLRWIIANLSSDGRPLALAFEGSLWGWIGWQLLLGLSFLTIIGWAWVMSAWIRWVCRNIAGTRRAVVFNGTGLEILWRAIIVVLASCLIIPIPWVVAWYYRWYVSQIALVPRVA